MIQEIFATPIYRCRYPDPSSLLGLLTSTACKMPGPTQDQQAYFGGDTVSGLFAWRRHNDPQPHEMPEFKNVCDFIDVAVKKYWDAMPYYPDVTPVVHESWITVYKHGGFIRSHNHGVPIDLVAAFYINSNADQGDLVLEHPLELLLSTQPYKLNRAQPSKFNHNITVESGDLVLFPAWMKHHSQPNPTEDARVVLTLDYIGKSQ